MTKKIFAMFLAVLMVVSMLPTSVFAAEATCPGNSGKHTLENCSYTMIKVTEPGCGTMGFTTYQCNVCKEIFSESWVPATGAHTWTDLPAKAPTCALPGYEAGKQCSVCGLEVPGATIPALDAEATECEWIDLTPTINCVTGGTKKYECASCKATYEVEIKPGEHNFDESNPELVKPATEAASGLAHVYCTLCGDYKEVEVLFVHDCEDYLYYNALVPATCTVDGMKAHNECRICGALWNTAGTKALTDSQIEDLVLTASHTFAHTNTCQCTDLTAPHIATCVDTLLYCEVCKQNIAVEIEHVFDFDNPDLPGVSATCTHSGYKYDLCDVCGLARGTENIPALGHKSITVNVPATCTTYAYSYTICVRGNCDSPAAFLPAEFDPSVYTMGVDVYAPMSGTPVVGQGYYFAMAQNALGMDLYFTGAMDGNYLATSHNSALAVKVYLEYVHCEKATCYAAGEYFLYFYNAEGVKTYIEIYEYKADKVGVHLTTEPVNSFEWDSTLGVLTTTLTLKGGATKTYYLGTYLNKGKTYETMSASEVKYISGSNAANVGVTQFPAYLCEVGVTGMPGKVIALTVNKTAGFNLKNHVYTSTPNPDATCTIDGEMIHQCVCGDIYTTVIPAAHKYTVQLTGKITVGNQQVDAYKAPTCEDGWQYWQCAHCDSIVKQTLTGAGHVWSALKEQTPDHINTVVYDYKECLCCGKVQNFTRKVWADAGKKWDSLAAAQAAHGDLLSAEPIYKNPLRQNCTVALYDTYSCAGCGKSVYVKIEGTGAHSVAPDYQAPGCVAGQEGGYSTYACAVCNAIIGNAAMGEWNVIAPTGHTWVAIKSYEAAPCEKPVYDNYTHYCANCGEQKNDGTKLLWIKTYTDSCIDMTFEYYLCHCGEEHIRNYQTAMDHNWVEEYRFLADGVTANPAVYQAPTCYAEGYTTYTCSYCKETKVKVLGKTAHTNAAGESFTDKCTDTVTDRHCVVCCKHYNHAALGNKHDCATADTNKDGVLDCLGQCIIGKFCHYAVNTNMPSTCLQDAYTLKICGDCGDQKVIPWVDSEWNGHKPANNYESYYLNDDGEVVELPYPQPMYLADYIYVEDYVWTHVEIQNGQFVNVASAPYTAKFIEYVEPTYTSEGYFKTYCQECDMVVTQTLPKKDGLGFELKAENANGAKEFTYGSLVEVTVSANALNESIYGFDFDVDYYGGLVYVGYETLNDNFILTVTEPAKASSYVNITGRAVNDASGKMQNIAIEADTALVKLFFRVMNNYGTSVSFVFDDAYAQAYMLKNNNMVPVACSYDRISVKTRRFLDFNKDGAAHVTDLFLAMSLLTGEHPDGKTYDVTMDINKDGEVTAEELTLAYEFSVGNVDLDDLLVMGMSEEEIELLNLNKVVLCNNSACEKEIPVDAVYCPFCGNHQ